MLILPPMGLWCRGGVLNCHDCGTLFRLPINFCDTPFRQGKNLKPNRTSHQQIVIIFNATQPFTLDDQGGGGFLLTGVNPDN